MKLIRRLLLVVVILIIAAGIVFYFGIDRLIKNEVQSQATSSLNLATTLNSAKLSLLGGSLNLNTLQIASPKGFTAPQMLAVGDTSLAVSYGQLRNEPIHVASIVIDKPKLVIEQQNGVLNFKKAMDDLPPGNSAPASPSSSSSSKPMKLIIDDLKLTDPQVVVEGLPGGSIPLTLPSLDLKNIGNADGAANGAALKDVVMQVITAMAGSASNSSALSGEFKALLSANVGSVVGQFGAAAQKQIAAAIPGDMGKALSQAVKDPQALIKNPGAALSGLLNGAGDKSGASGSDKNSPVNAIEGLLGGNKPPKK